MDKERILRAYAKYDQLLADMGIEPQQHPDDTVCISSDAALAHVRWMFPQVQTFIEEGRIDKAMRWLCWAQGVLWRECLVTIADEKADNRPPE